jgi:hypothetical protein
MVFQLQKKVGQISIMDALLIAGVKSFEERLIGRFVGNGTILSGMVKGIAGGVISSAVKGKFGDIVGTALIVDAGEDIVTALLGGTATQSITSSGGRASVRVL